MYTFCELIEQQLDMHPIIILKTNTKSLELDFWWTASMLMI